MNDRFRMRLYALTCVACTLWITQETIQSIGNGTVGDLSNIILSICILVAILYTGANALSMWRQSKRPTGDDANEHADDDPSLTASPSNRTDSAADHDER